MWKLISLCNFIVNSVGDANFIFLQNCGNSIMLDCGVQKQSILEKNNAYLKRQLEFSNELIVSHYHIDHFNALYGIEEKSLHIRKLYYPYIPRFESQEKLIKEINFSIFLKSLSYLKSGSCAFDLVSLLNEKSSEKLSYTPLHIGMTVGNNSQYEVIWPPKSINDFYDSSLAKKIKDIEDFIKKNSELSSLWESFDRAKIDDNQCLKLDYSELKINKEYLDENKNDIQTIERKVKAITNKFSICLYSKDKFLFLGDLEKEEVSKCLENLRKKVNCDKFLVKYFITPHHGTKNHYFEGLEKIINAEYVISSNGQKRIKDYEKAYDSIGHYSHCTHLNGDFYGVENLSERIVVSVIPPGTIILA